MAKSPLYSAAVITTVPIKRSYTDTSFLLWRGWSEGIPVMKMR